MKTGSPWNYVNTIRSDTNSAVRALRIIFTKDRPSTKTESMGESKNDSEAAGSVWLTQPVDDESTSKPNGSSSRHLR